MKTWIKTNLNKITLALALTGATTGTIGLIMGGVLTHENKKFNYYLKPNHEVVFGDTTIWADYFDSSGKKKMDLYFSNISKQPNHDVKWDGIYISGYFDN